MSHRLNAPDLSLQAFPFRSSRSQAAWPCFPFILVFGQECAHFVQPLLKFGFDFLSRLLGGA
jgi:hypothetical protein